MVKNLIYIGYDNYDELNNKILIPNGFSSLEEYQNLSYQKDNFGDIFSCYHWNYSEEIFIRKNIKNISEDDKYIYPFQFLFGTKFSQYNPSELFFQIPNNVLNDLKNKRAVLLLDVSFEGFSTFDSINLFKKFNQIIDYYSLPKKSIFLLNGNFKNEKININHLRISLWESLHSSNISNFQLDQIKNNIKNKEIKKFKCSCLNRLNRNHRSYLAYLLYDDIIKHGNCIYTMSNDFKNRIYIKDGNQDKINEISNSLPWKYDIDNSNIYDPSLNWDINIDIHLNSYFHIITETLVEENSIFFSEKTFKPIKMMQPFILVSSCGSLNKLKEFGYQTFPELFNEEYDLIEDTNKRIEFISNEIKRVYSFSKEELSEILFNMVDKLEFNSVLYKKRGQINVLKTILEEIKSKWD